MVSFNKKLLLTFRINLNPSTNQDVATTDFNFAQSPKGGRRKLAALAQMPSHRSSSGVLAGEQQPHCERTHFYRGFPILLPGLSSSSHIPQNTCLSHVCPVLFLSRCVNDPLLYNCFLLSYKCKEKC